jgi:mevalonate pyrophosphate decarboxylase
LSAFCSPGVEAGTLGIDAVRERGRARCSSGSAATGAFSGFSGWSTRAEPGAAGLEPTCVLTNTPIATAATRAMTTKTTFLNLM